MPFPDHRDRREAVFLYYADNFVKVRYWHIADNPTALAVVRFWTIADTVG
jgi:hypothetical protein